jgi:hypothetical protein
MMMGCLMCRFVFWIALALTKTLASKLRGNILFCFREYVKQIIQNEAKSYTFGSDYVSTNYATMNVYIILTIQIKFLI